MPDLLAKKTKPNAKMRQDTNPIAIFAVNEKRGKENEMKVVAIQIDNKPSKIQLFDIHKKTCIQTLLLNIHGMWYLDILGAVYLGKIIPLSKLWSEICVLNLYSTFRSLHENTSRRLGSHFHLPFNAR